MKIACIYVMTYTCLTNSSYPAVSSQSRQVARPLRRFSAVWEKTVHALILRYNANALLAPQLCIVSRWEYLQMIDHVAFEAVFLVSLKRVFIVTVVAAMWESC